MSETRHPLLDELERYVEGKLARIEAGEGCMVLLAVELGSAVNALEGIGVSGAIRVGDRDLEIGKASQ